MASCHISLSLILAFIFLFAANNSELTDAADTLLPTQSVKDGQTLTSANQSFELGFFSPGNSSSRYVGIWYLKISPKTVVWVANRESPLVDRSGVLGFAADGKLVIIDGRGGSYEVASVSTSTDMVATILDTGNLVLKDGINSSQVLWQSFDYPTDTLLPGMTFGLTSRRNRLLTAWKSADDAAAGDFSVGGDPNETARFFIWQKNRIYWDSGFWNGMTFRNIPELTESGVYNLSYFMRDDGNYYFKFVLTNNSIVSRWVLSSSGEFQQLVWAYNEWLQLWAVPKSQCDVYNLCGDFGVCFEGNLAHCQCLMGFQPASQEDWNMGVTGGGCLRKAQLKCETQGSADGFLLLNNMKFPVDGHTSDAINYFECESSCFRNCSCFGFAFSESCQLWHGDLKDLQQLNNAVKDKAGTLYVRLAASELRGKKRRLQTVVMVPVILVTFLLISFLSFWLIRRYRGKGNLNQALPLLVFNTDITRNLGKDGESGADFKVFCFAHVADATDNFSTENKLGEGGFGPVYKGRLSQGQEIAVKRLSTCSGQGFEEFKNEILLIAKLQHRNLVKLLGCCIERGEKILIYEYMPNKSLDFFLFDPNKRAQLDWTRRLHIIEGIAQGLLYLHKHSRLRIIHRDLKASNILLDGDMNPKISDFGMARIFNSNESQANTNRVVGTYGYMSPEYASEGLFSIKSDVFSFGVLLLEILSGKRNAGFHQYGNSLNLLGYAWELWKEGKWMELMDPSVADNCATTELLKCINVSLLCVQESAADRPTMSEVIAMLSGEGVNLPEPKHPAFFNLRMVNKADLSRNTLHSCSINNVTFTAEGGR